MRVFKDVVQSFKFSATNKYAYTIKDTLDAVGDQLHNKIRDNRNDATQKKSISVNEILDKNIGKHNNQKEYGWNTSGYRREFNKNHTSNKLILSPEDDINDLLDDLEMQVIQKRFNNMAEHEESSNHRSLYFDTVYLKFHKINNPGVRSYIKTPIDLKNKYATVNPKNYHDNKCFLYAIGISVFGEHLNQQKLRDITKNLKELFEKLNTKSISYSPTAREIDQFEKDNLDIAISIFGYKGFEKINVEENNDNDIDDFCIEDLNIDDDENEPDSISNSDTSGNNNNKSRKVTKSIQIGDIRISKYAGQREHTVNLLVITEGDKKDYLGNRSISRLFRGSLYDRGMEYCDRCYSSFRAKKRFK